MQEKIKKDKVHEFLDVLKEYDFSLGLLKIMYRKREGFTVNSLNDNLNIGYQKIHRFLTRLKSLGFLRGGKSLKLSQTGLEVFKTCIQLDIDRDFVETLAGKNIYEVLEFLSEKRNWKDIKNEIKVGSSSIKNMMDSLIDKELVEKMDGKYVITPHGKKSVEKYRKIINIPLLPKYEVQVKFSGVKSISKEVSDRFGLKKTKEMEQEDRYYKARYSQKFSENYLRLRVERYGGSSLKESLSHKISWSNTIDSWNKEGIKILEREKETLNTKYPEILFFLDYFDAKEKVQIIKKRETYRNKHGLVINLDEMKKPIDNNYIEIKYAVRERDKIREAVNKVKELTDAMNLKKDNIEKGTYVEISEKYGK
ncbi:MAG: winged helix-turn-helix domain-containing protein [Candidatus Aenigmatarchaeota archaeon]